MLSYNMNDASGNSISKNVVLNGLGSVIPPNIPQPAQQLQQILGNRVGQLDTVFEKPLYYQAATSERPYIVGSSGGQFFGLGTEGEPETPWYKNWKYWAGIGVGVAAVGAGYWYMTRNKAATSPMGW